MTPTVCSLWKQFCLYVYLSEDSLWPTLLKLTHCLYVCLSEDSLCPMSLSCMQLCVV